MIYIYCLQDPTTFTTRYVGATNNPTQREFNRLTGRSVESKEVMKWLFTLATPPVMKVVCVVEDCEGKRVEDALKRSLLVKGVTLLNDKGRGHKHTEEVKKRMSESQLKHWEWRRQHGFDKRGE